MSLCAPAIGNNVLMVDGPHAKTCTTDPPLFHHPPTLRALIGDAMCQFYLTEREDPRLMVGLALITT